MASKKKTPAKPNSFLADLSPAEFADLAKALIERELDRCGVAPSDGRTTVANNYPDGGIDYLVGAAAARNSHWLNGPTVFQFKRSKPTLSAIKGEILGTTPKTKATSKPLRRLLRLGAEYRLVIGSEVAPATAKELEAALDKFFKTKRYKGRASVVALDRIELWLRSHLSLMSRVPTIKALAKHQLRTWEEWRDDPELALQVDEFPWVPDPPRERDSGELLRIAEERGIVRVEGPAGIGKSRFVFEALGKVRSSVCYLSDEPTDLASLFAFSPGELWGWLVVDECDAEEHARIARLVRPPGLKVVTIGATDAPGTRAGPGVVRLELLNQDEFEVLASKMKTPALDIALRKQLARRCVGYPKLLRLASLAVSGAGLAEIVSDPALTQALTRLLAPDDSDVARAIQLLSLPTSFTDADRECLQRAEGLPVRKMEMAVSALQKRALLGGYRTFDVNRTSRQYVTPGLFAEWMALELWGSDPLAVLSRVIEAKPPSGLIEKIFRQLLASHGFAAIQQALLAQPARLEKLLSTEGLKSVAEALSYRFPQDTFEFVRRLLPVCKQEERGAFQNALITVAWFKELFEPAVQLLADIAPRERDLAQLFGTVLGPTEANGEDRLEVLRGWASSPAPERRRLALACAFEAARHEVGRSIDPRLPMDRNWKPTTRGEELQYRGGAVSLVVGLLNDDRLGSEAKLKSRQLIDDLIREGFVILAVQVSNALLAAGCSKEEIRDVFRRFVRSDRGLLSDHDRAQIAHQLERLAPATLREVVEEVAGRLDPLQTEALTALARALIASRDERDLAPFFAEGAYLAFDVGAELGRDDQDRRLLPLLLQLSRSQPNNRLVCGYVSTLTGQPSREDLLDEWSTDPSLARLVFDATRLISPSARGLERLGLMFREGRIDRAWVRQLSMGGFLNRLAPRDVLAFLASVEFEPVAVHSLLFMRQRYAPEESIRKALFEAWKAVPLSSLASVHDNWEWLESAKLFQNERPSEVGAHLAEALGTFDVALSLRHDLGQLDIEVQRHAVAALYERTPIASPALVGALRVEEFADWAIEWSTGDSKRQLFLASLIERVYPGGLADRLLSSAPRHEALKGIIASRLGSGSGWGSESQLVSGFVARATRLIENAGPPLQKLAKAKLKELKLDLDEARARERYEHESGELLMVSEGAPRFSR